MMDGDHEQLAVDDGESVTGIDGALALRLVSCTPLSPLVIGLNLNQHCRQQQHSTTLPSRDRQADAL